METLTFLGLSLVLTGGALWVIGCLVTLCNAGRPKVQIRSISKTEYDKALIRGIKSKGKYINEAREWQKETKITLAPSRRLCEEAVKHLN